jgi:hypothetical protein
VHWAGSPAGADAGIEPAVSETTYGWRSLGSNQGCQRPQFYGLLDGPSSTSARIRRAYLTTAPLPLGLLRHGVNGGSRTRGIQDHNLAL